MLKTKTRLILDRALFITTIELKIRRQHYTLNTYVLRILKEGFFSLNLVCIFLPESCYTVQYEHPGIIVLVYWQHAASIADF